MKVKSPVGQVSCALCAMLVSFEMFAVGPVLAGGVPADVPSLGYSPQNMDKAVDPRQDFYRYAAGNWLKKTEIAPSPTFSRL
jgi:hypothetical protein